MISCQPNVNPPNIMPEFKVCTVSEYRREKKAQEYMKRKNVKMREKGKITMSSSLHRVKQMGKI